MIGPLRRPAVGALMLSLSVASGCDDPTGGPAPSTDIEPVLAVALTRDQPLGAPSSASAVIGDAGGSLELRAAGLKVTVPPRAVTEPTLIRVTSVPGAVVAYEFHPHGLVFEVPIVVKQDLVGTSWFRLTNSARLEAGYFVDGAEIDHSAGHVLVREFVPTAIDLNTQKAQFPVSHFSGYMLSTGRR